MSETQACTTGTIRFFLKFKPELLLRLICKPSVVFLFILFFFLSAQLHAGNITSKRSGGNWTNPDTWVGGIVPTENDDVLIDAGTSVIVNSAPTVCRNLTINGILNIIGPFLLEVHGSWENNGTFNAGSAGTVEFKGSDNATVSGISVSSFKELLVNKGSDRNSLLEISQPVVILKGGHFSLLNGLIVISNRGSLTGSFNNMIGIPSSGGIKVNGGTLITGDASVQNKGLFQVSGGMASIGQLTAGQLVTSQGGTFRIDGGTLNLTGSLVNTDGAASISGGTIQLSTIGFPEQGKASFDMSAACELSMTGGNVVFNRTRTTESLLVDIRILKGSSQALSGGTFQMGTAATPTGTTFLVDSEISLEKITVFNECLTRVINTSKNYNQQAGELRTSTMLNDRNSFVLTPPEDILVSCGSAIPGSYASLNSFTNAGGKGTLNCTLNAESFRLVSEEQSSASCPYVITRTYQVSDIFGSVGTAKQLIFVEGTLSQPVQEKTAEVADVKSPALKSAKTDFTASTGNWSDPDTWGGSVPTATDNVTIPNGVTVTVDVAAFCNNISIQSGGTLISGGANKLHVNGNWTNDGTYNSGASGVMEFAGSAPASIQGTASNTFQNMILAKGSGLSDLLSVESNATINNLTFTTGVLKINNGTTLISDITNTNNAIPKPSGLIVSGGTLNTGNFSIENNGLIQVTSGTANFGTHSGNTVHTQIDGAFIVSGGTVKIAGRLENTAAGTLAAGIPSGISISNGTVTLSAVGNGLTNVGSLNVTPNGAFNFTGGTIVFQNESTATTAIDLGLVSGAGLKNTVGGTFQFGNALTPANTVFNISSNILLNRISSFPNADIQLVNDVSIGQLALDPATTIDLNGKKIRLSASATGSYDFPLDNGSGVAIPASVTFTGGTFAGGAYIELQTFASDHPDNASNTNYLNRYWSLSSSGISSPEYNFTATYATTDVVGTESEIAIGRWSGALPWLKGNDVNAVSHTLSATGLTSTPVSFAGITSDPPVVTATATPGTICLGSSSALDASLTGDSPFLYSWSPATGLTATDIVNPVASPLVTTSYTLTVTDANGFTGNGSVTVTVDPASVGGSVAGSETVCSGTNSTTLTLSGHTGVVVRWESSTDNWTTTTSIANTTTSHTVTNLLTTTKYRAVVQSGICSPDNSVEATITVDPESVGGSLAGSGSVCTGTTVQL